MRVCSTPGCPTIYPPSEGSRCAEHRKAADRKHWANTRAYNTKGHRKRFRPGVLNKDPICVICKLKQSVVADHYPLSRIDLVDLGMDADDPQYGRGLCAECDKTQTAERQPGGWNTR